MMQWEIKTGSHLSYLQGCVIEWRGPGTVANRKRLVRDGPPHVFFSLKKLNEV